MPPGIDNALSDVKPLTDFVENHPIVTAAVGVGSGLASKLLSALHVVAGVAADLAVLLGFGTALIAFLLTRLKYRRELEAEAAAREARATLERYEREGRFDNHGAE